MNGKAENVVKRDRALWSLALGFEPQDGPTAATGAEEKQ